MKAIENKSRFLTLEKRTYSKILQKYKVFFGYRKTRQYDFYKAFASHTIESPVQEALFESCETRILRMRTLFLVSKQALNQ